eukprot:TRINITY_DN16597_c0_g1_i1.p1 TRINITY_DN16597_c0_g1~~TRINITY_DN16597_c0_g1_i1.p1  ORF type:complete len:233 (-),score=86.61 TRINITY_DN16597_c0_g1_i1:67-765(-)
MVVFTKCSDERYIVFRGKDKFENDDLIKHSFPEDIWFHVDKHSSAHIYLRLPPGSMDLMHIKDKDEAKAKLLEGLKSVPEEVLQEMCQLTKQNSIDGCKLAAVDIVYTPFLNLQKTQSMDTGTVGFKDEAFRFLVKNVEKDKEVVKRQEKSEFERVVDFAKEKAQRDDEERQRRKKLNAQRQQEQKELDKKHAEEKELKSYAALQGLDMQSNENVTKTGTIEECREIEDDFM